MLFHNESSQEELQHCLVGFVQSIQSHAAHMPGFRGSPPRPLPSAHTPCVKEVVIAKYLRRRTSLRALVIQYRRLTFKIMTAFPEGVLVSTVVDHQDMADLCSRFVELGCCDNKFIQLGKRVSDLCLWKSCLKRKGFPIVIVI